MGFRHLHFKIAVFIDLFQKKVANVVTLMLWRVYENLEYDLIKEDLFF